MDSLPCWFCSAEQEPANFLNLIPMFVEGSVLPDHQPFSLEMLIICVSLNDYPDSIQCVVLSSSQHHSWVFSDQYSFLLRAENDFLLLTAIILLKTLLFP